jgi:biotin carboxylase
VCLPSYAVCEMACTKVFETQMKRILLVDTNRAAVPIYRALCAMGHEVWVVGGKPTETLAKLADNYVELDYSDADRLSGLVDELCFDYLVPGCTDLSYQVCAEINDGRFPGIDSPASTSAINTKSEFRKIAAELGLSIPRVLTMKDVACAESVIVKPVDSFSGRGMTVLHAPHPGELNDAFDVACKASNTGDAIIEEFIQGQLFSHSAFIWDGEVVADFVVQEDCTVNPYTVDTSRIATSFSGEMLESLRRSIRHLASSLHLTNGVVHTQFIAHANRYWIIEITRRCPGDIYSLLIELSTGYPYAASYAAPFVGEAPCSMDEAAIHERITRHTVTSKDGAPLWGFQFSAPVDIRLFVPLATSGDFIGPSPYGRAGIFFFRSPSDDDQENLYRNLLGGDLYSFS